MEYLYKSPLLAYIAELGEVDPAVKYEMLQLFREIDKGRFDAKNISRMQDDLYEAALKAKEAIEVWSLLMNKMELK